ncbi:MAG: hypothetical protein WBW33_32915 [Bryobacteraceae bacterium]
MKKALFGSVSVMALILQTHAWAQSPVQEKVAMVKAAVAQNKAALMHYIWTEQTNIMLNGEVKKTTNYQCMYGPDGSVQKTATGGTPPPAPKRGLRGKIVENKTEDLTDYMQRAATLVKQYVPPNPEQIQGAFQQGNVTIGTDGPEVLQLQFTNYVKPGDSMVFYFNKQAKALSQITVNSYMNDQTDAVSLQVNFQTIPGGPNYVAQTTLNAPAKKITVQTTSSNYQKMAQ